MDVSIVDYRFSKHVYKLGEQAIHQSKIGSGRRGRVARRALTTLASPLWGKSGISNCSSNATGSSGRRDEFWPIVGNITAERNRSELTADSALGKAPCATSKVMTMSFIVSLLFVSVQNDFYLFDCSKLSGCQFRTWILLTNSLWGLGWKRSRIWRS